MAKNKSHKTSLYFFLVAAVIVFAYLFYLGSTGVLFSPDEQSLDSDYDLINSIYGDYGQDSQDPKPDGRLKPRTPSPHPIIPCTCSSLVGYPSFNALAPGACKIQIATGSLAVGTIVDGTKTCHVECLNLNACVPIGVPVSTGGSLTNDGDTLSVKSCSIVCPPGSTPV